ncbi:MAG TPA: ORF6N domain-containing protein, partial [Candidatus Udaeobacter sp.]|nr:ORF6N domain-containing protein [Candidatus Udaeobacter sp.]
MSKDIIPIQRIAQAILVLRNQRVILDYDLAVLYSVETRALKQAVRRNPDRFPRDFMFELSEQEIDMVVSQFVTPNRRKF